MKLLFEIYMFYCCRKENRDGIGWWKVQAGLCVYIWLQTLLIFTLIAEAYCKVNS